MKARFSLLVLFLFCISFILVPYRSNQSAVQAYQASVSDDEALQMLARGKLVPVEAPVGLAPAVLPDSFIKPSSIDAPASLTGDIAFSNARDGVYNLFVKNASGGADRLLSGSPGNDATPSWAPDKTQLVFASDRDGDFDIYLKTALGGEINLTNNSVQDIHPSWSPDGQRILFSSNRGGSYYQAYSMDLSGQNVERIGVIANNVLWPRFSPNGGRIAFMRASITIPACDWNWDIWLMDANGQNQRRITTQLGGDIYPNWTPDGRIVYGSCRNFIDSDLFIVHPDTGDETRVNNWFGSNEWQAAFSPGGDYFAFNTNVDGDSEIYIAPTDGGTAFSFTNNAEEDLAPSWTISTVGPCLGAAARKPIMMVTGWSGSQGKTYLSQDEQLSYFVQHLVNHGYVEGCNLFYATGTSPYRFLYLDVPGEGGESNATIIRDNLCDAAQDAARWIPGWDGTFDIIAHSYGGLRSRAYLERDDLYGFDENSGKYGTICPDTSQHIRVDNLFTLGTPHGGEWPILPFALYIGFDAVKGDTAEFDPEIPAIVEMLPPIREAQNLLNNQPLGVSYHLIAGDTREQLATEPTPLYLVYALWPPARVEENDFAVHLSSAQALTTFPFNYPRLLTPPKTPDIHGQVPWALDPLNQLRSLVNPSTTFENEVCPHIPLLYCQTSAAARLLDSEAGPITTYESVVEWAAAQSESQPLPSMPMQDIQAGVLSGSESVSGQFELSGSGSSSVMAAWLDGTVELTLVDPTGKQIDSETAVDDPNIDYLFFDGGFGLTASYQMTTTVSGTWTYTLTAQNLTNPTGFRLLAIPPTPIGVGPAAPHWAPNGAPAVITATVAYDSNIPVTGGVVTARIRRPDDSFETLTLLDNGSSQDGAANDGVFGATYTQTDLGGIYGVLLTAEGSYEGESYERMATTYFTVAPASAVLSDSYSDRGVSNNELGLYEYLELTTTLNVSQAGVYAVSANLYAGDTFVTHTNARAQLTPGNHAMRLYFDGAEIRSAGLDGPYTVRNVLLLDESQVTVMIEVRDFVYTTAAYSHSQFGWPSRLFLPMILGD